MTDYQQPGALMSQPQLEQYFLGDHLPPASGVPLYFDLGASAAGTAP